MKKGLAFLIITELLIFGMVSMVHGDVVFSESDFSEASDEVDYNDNPDDDIYWINDLVDDDEYIDEENNEYFEDYEGEDEDPERPNYEESEEDDYEEDDDEENYNNIRVGSGYSKVSYRDWTQQMSKYKAVCKSGCRIVTFSRILYMAGFQEVGNPDEYFNWGRKNGVFEEGGAEYTPFASSLRAFASSHKGKAEIIADIEIDGYKSINVNTVMDYIRQGYFVVLWGKDHQTMFSNEESKKMGEPVICDTYRFSGDYAYGINKNYIKLRDYGLENEAQYYDHITVFDIRKIQETYSIRYELDGGANGINPDAYTKGATFDFNSPQKDNFLFGGWYLDNEYVNEITCISEENSGDLILYARWVQSGSDSFYDTGGTYGAMDGSQYQAQSNDNIILVENSEEIQFEENRKKRETLLFIIIRKILSCFDI